MTNQYRLLNGVSGNERAPLTHPICASLDHPLFCKQKRG